MCNALLVFQSTPPCGGEFHADEGGPDTKVSIHAPVRGRIGHVSRVLGTIRVSIHAPVRGRIRGPRRCESRPVFQSTPPCGGECSIFEMDGTPTEVSIHAPVRGRIALADRVAESAAVSIHAPVRGRMIAGSICTESSQFQSTPPCGGESGSGVLLGRAPSFNPRPRAGANQARRAW